MSDVTEREFLNTLLSSTLSQKTLRADLAEFVSAVTDTEIPTNYLKSLYGEHFTEDATSYSVNAYMNAFYILCNKEKQRVEKSYGFFPHVFKKGNGLKTSFFGSILDMSGLEYARIPYQIRARTPFFDTLVKLMREHDEVAKTAAAVTGMRWDNKHMETLFYSTPTSVEDYDKFLHENIIVTQKYGTISEPEYFRHNYIYALLRVINDYFTFEILPKREVLSLLASFSEIVSKVDAANKKK